MTHLIKVTNKNDFEIKDYCDGIPYVFTPDEPVNVPAEAVKHIFGMQYPADEAVLKSFSFREKAFWAVARRWGWNSHSKEKIAEYRKVFNNILFTPIIMQQVELVAKAPDLAEPREKPVRLQNFTKSEKAEEETEEEIEESPEEEVA